MLTMILVAAFGVEAVAAKTADEGGVPEASRQYGRHRLLQQCETRSSEGVGSVSDSFRLGWCWCDLR